MVRKVLILLDRINDFNWEFDVEQRMFADFLSLYVELEGTDRQPEHPLILEKVRYWNVLPAIRKTMKEIGLSFKLNDMGYLSLIDFDQEEDKILDDQLSIM